MQIKDRQIEITEQEVLEDFRRVFSVDKEVVVEFPFATRVFNRFI